MSNNRLSSIDVAVACHCGANAAALLNEMKRISIDAPSINKDNNDWFRLPVSLLCLEIEYLSDSKIQREIKNLEAAGLLKSNSFGLSELDTAKYYCFTGLELPIKKKIAFKKQPIKMGLRTKVFKKDGYCCVSCQSTENLSADHIYPESKGGATELKNLQTLCLSCNQSKGTKTMEEWLGGAK